jgi:methylmalonic aciduria homocystinuria type C protein
VILDLIHPFDVGRVGLGLPDFGRAHAHGVLVGNTGAMWGHFLAALPSLGDEDDPLDRWVEAQVREAASRIAVRTELRFAHERDANGGFLPIQRIAMAAGLAWLSPAHLSVHPVYGPWISLRAVIVLDEDFPGETRAIEDPCGACETGCAAHALPPLPAADEDPVRAVATRWREWLAPRDACPLGRAHRFDARMIE